MWRDLVAGLVDLVFPPICAQCQRGTDGAALCAACDPAACGGGPGAALPDVPAPAPLASWTAAVAYEGAARDWIRRFKYPRPGLAALDPAANAVARDWIRRAASRAPGPAPDLVVPVPLHAARLRARGFNQAAVLARDAARAAGARADAAGLVRLRATPPQAGLGRAARRRNVAGVFAARRAMPPRVWLVDDIATTGATLASAARTVRRAGAREVHGLTLAWRPLIR